MQITNRDVDILRFINESGFCTTPQLCRRFGVKNWRVYQLMKRLVEAGFVNQVRIFHGKPNIYYLTNKGAGFTDLPALDRINVGGFEHQLNLINVVIRLGELYPAANWISERRLKLDKYSTGLGVRGHMADGLLVFSEEHQVAFEVELTLKSKHRLEGILKAYTAQIAFKEVWYFCAPYVMPTLTKLVAKKPFIKVHDIEEFLL